MEEENKVFDEMDLNQDGKVTFGEKVQFYANKASDQLSDVAEDVKAKSEVLIQKTKEKAAIAKEKASDLAAKAVEEIKETYQEAKEGIAEVTKDLKGEKDA